MSTQGVVALLLILSQFVLFSPPASAAPRLSFTSSSSARFQVGSAGSFSVVTVSPNSSRLYMEPGTSQVPSWLSFSDNGNGTGTLMGTPTTGSAASYALTLVVTGPDRTSASQAFTLFVDTAPVITSANHTTFTSRSAGSFTVTTTGGSPAATTITETGSLPSGVGFSDNGDGTATLAGTPASGTGGTYPISITATAAAAVSHQSFTLTVNEAATFTSSASTRFQAGVAGSFSVVTSSPAVTLSHTGGSFPDWLTLVDNGNGTGSLVGTAPAGSEASYTFTLVAAGQSTANVTQSFTLYVDQSPVIRTADHTTFRTGTAGSFTVTTTAGHPTTTVITESGALPSGVSFTDNADGTATLAGTPTVGGTYAISIVASAAGGTAAGTVQSFTLTVTASPMITSPDHVTFLVGTASTFSITTSGGFPAASTLTMSGTLPSGATFVDNGDGTATLSGTPAAGCGGTYVIVVTASNGTLPEAAQTFTLTVQERPLFSSEDRVAFAAGAASSFSVTTYGGFPAPSVTIEGTLPSGVTFADNGNGTGTLSGTPAAGTGGIYELLLKASNGVLPEATQTFTLVVVESPEFTSANKVTFTEGMASTFSVTTSGGFPTPVLSLQGELPTGLTFTANEDGTATLSGTPAARTARVYVLELIACNGVLLNATQTFTLRVQGPPSITSSNAVTFTEGVAAQFVVTTGGGLPSPASLTLTGTLPEAVTFVDNGNGTGTLAGTAKAAGTFTLYITASNGIAPSAEQTLVLTVVQAGVVMPPVVTPVADTTSTTTTPTPTGTQLLASTGVDIDSRLALAAFGMLLLGGILVALGRRRGGQA